tara:strand:+ start:2395 stop:2685 length:291 start_codon:yes stop_codon:yes gene_type:complete
MSSQEKYNNFGDVVKFRITNLLKKGYDEYYIRDTFGLSLKFTRNVLWPKIQKVKIVYFGSKQESYYENEMDYGKLELNYSFSELNNNKIQAYNNYE